MTTTTATFGTTLQGTLASNATDTYKLTAGAAGAVHIDFVHPAGPGSAGPSFGLQLLDALGNVLLDKTANGNLALDATVAAAGDYYLKVIDPTAGGGGPGDYAVTTALSGKAGTTYDGGANNTTATAIPTALGAPIVGSLTTSDADVFKFHASAGGVVNLDFVHPNGVGKEGNSIAIQLTDAAGNVVIESATAGNTVLTTTVAAAGDYYVKVSDGNPYQYGDGGLYTLTPTVTSAPATTYDGAANNTNPTALASAMGTPIVGSLNASDADVFKVRADAGGVLTLDFTHPNGVGKEGNSIAIEVTDAAGNLVIKTTTAGDTVLTTTVAAAGDYYVKVADGNPYQYGDGGLYTLVPTLATAPDTTYDGAANDNTSTAIASAMGTPIVGSLNASDADVFKVHADAGGVVTLDFTHPNGAGKEGNAIAIQLTDAAGNVVIETTTAGNTVLTTTVAAAGDYYLKVSDGNQYQYGDGGIYTIKPSLVTLPGVTYDGAANNTSATAIKAALPGAIAGSLNNGDSDVFSFSAAAGGTLSINLAHPDGAGSGGAGIALTVLDTKGGTVFTKTLAGSDLVAATLPSAGDYYLKVSDGNSYAYNDGGVYTVMAGVASNGGGTLDGSAANDRLAGSAGNDVINGAGGIDTLAYAGNAADYQVAISAAGVSVIDTTGRDGADTLFNVERLQFADRTMSLDTSGVAAQAYRVYQAAFDRAPDAVGLGFWITNMERGTSLTSVAQAFIDSEEFRETYGADPSHHDMVAKFYTNVLHRAPDQSGLEFWVHALDTGVIDAAAALVGFSESAENIAQLTGTIAHGIAYVPFG